MFNLSLNKKHNAKFNFDNTGFLLDDVTVGYDYPVDSPDLNRP